MATTKRTNIELQIFFKKQLKRLTKFCFEFDNRNEDAALIIAGILRTLLHDSTTNKNFDTRLIKQTEVLKKCCYDKNNFKDLKIFKDFQKLASSINDQVKNAQKTKVVSKSLLTLLNANNVNFLDTSIKPKAATAYYHIAAPNEFINDILFKHNLPYLGLCAKEVFINDKITHLKYIPLFKHPNFKIDFTKSYSKIAKTSFDNWWNGDVFDNFNGFTLTRKDLILSVTNLDGYAHIDENIKPEYETFKKADTITLQSPKVKIFSTYRNIPINPTIRQIAFELIYTIDNELRHLLDKSNLNFDPTPFSLKLTFEVTIDSMEKEGLVINTIFSKRPFIQMLQMSSSFIDDPNPNKTFIIHSISQEELKKIIEALTEKKIELRNINIDGRQPVFPRYIC